MARLKIIIATFVLSLAGMEFLYSQEVSASFTFYDVQPCTGQTVVIQWSFTPGSDSLAFEIEKSRDMINWKRTARMAPQLSHQYFSIDSDPGYGLIYYRVKRAGNDKQISFSPVKWVQISNDGEMYIWPNPARDVLHVRTPYVKGVLHISDPSGKLMMEIIITGLITDVPILRLAKGAYFIHVRAGEETLVEKFIKE